MKLKVLLVVIGDNIDRQVNPREMRIENQVKSLHYFHAFAALNRIETLRMDDTKSVGTVSTLPLSTFVPSPQDCATLRDNYVILVSRVLVQHIPHFLSLKKHVLESITLQS